MGFGIGLRRAALAALVCCLGLASARAGAEPGAIAPATSPAATEASADRGSQPDAGHYVVGGFAHPRPAGIETLTARTLWRRGIEAETREAFGEAIEAYTLLVAEAPGVAYPYWKIARNLWRHGEALPVDAKDERMAVFMRAETWARRGLEVDAQCAECMLWRFGAMGRIATTRGLLASLRAAPEMYGLLERGIELEPTFADSPYNTALGNLYYASAVFHRMVPEWRWLGWTLGVRGDLDRALAMIRSAKAISPERIDYTVELGAILSCYAARRGDAQAGAEARHVLASAQTLPVRMDQDPLDLEHAATLLEKPDMGCGYSRDGWIDLERADAERVARSAR